MNERTRKRPGPKPGAPPRVPVEERFLAKVDKSGDCWLWTACTEKDGYGSCWYEGRMHGAHRVAHMIFIGSIPAGFEVDHTCFNVLCVKPSHLRLATRKQNKENPSGLISTNSTGVRGVYSRPRSKRWYAEIKHNGQHVYVGSFKTIEEAAEAVRAKRNELFTHNLLDRKGA